MGLELMAEPTAGTGVDEEGLTPVKPVEAELLVVTGMSGAGRSTASDALEDHGWYVVENLPPQMLGTLAELGSHAPQTIPRLAVVVDVRSKALFADIRAALHALAASGVTFRVLFLDASDDVLVRRFEQGRRPHPLQGGGKYLFYVLSRRGFSGHEQLEQVYFVGTVDRNVQRRKLVERGQRQAETFG